MTEQVITKTQISLQVEESQNSLPDESDQIIADLHQQLARLKSRISEYEKSQTDSPMKDGSTSSQQVWQRIQLQIKREQIASLLNQQTEDRQRAGLLPTLMRKLQDPVATISANLEQLIYRVQDPEVSRAIQQCKNMAVSMIQGMQKLNDLSLRLDLELSPIKKSVDLLSLFKMIAGKLNTQGAQTVKLLASPQFSQKTHLDQELFQQAILALLKEIFHVTREEVIKISLKQGTVKYYDVEKEQVEVALFGELDWSLPPDREMEEFLRRSFEASEEAGLELLYAKKIIEKHGGLLSFYRENGKVVGFEITLPVQEKAL